MKPEEKSKKLLATTRAKSKMLEYQVPFEHQNIDLTLDPSRLLTISIAILGDIAAKCNREEFNQRTIAEQQDELMFASHFFDSFVLSRLNEELDQYLQILGSTAYYLCGIPGSSSILAGRLNVAEIDLDRHGIGKMLLWLLQSNGESSYIPPDGPIHAVLTKIASRIIAFKSSGSDFETLIQDAMRLRTWIYANGTPRELLLSDLVTSVVKKKIQNSIWNAIPYYSDIPKELWRSTFERPNFFKELWPAQHLIGESNVFRGESAVIQMPTSAGKSRAIELIIRSSFLSGRATLAVIVAPFRSLCHEISSSMANAFERDSVSVNELSDALQADFDMADFVDGKQIIVVTPEKLQFILRQDNRLSSLIGLLIFDEGHQFDNGTRGITYELLLTSLKALISEATQKVLISAVISNAPSVSKWLNGNENIATGKNLNPTFRTIGFASWNDRLGQIHFVNPHNPDELEYFVPRVIETVNYGKKGKQRKDRVFPEHGDAHSVALFLGFNLVHNGSVAIFCGTKATASTICKTVENVFLMGFGRKPSDLSNSDEVEALHRLFAANLGENSSATISAKYGVFSHHNSIPHGIRVAVEYAMREGLIRFVVCTSTLAQGVNLPIKYLLLTGTRQGLEQIKIRDFHNLIGRAGRSGMHTEGSVIFSDHSIYDNRAVFSEKWKWEQVKVLLDPSKSEACVSSISQLIPLIIYNNRNDSHDELKHELKWDIIHFAQAYTQGKDAIESVAEHIAATHRRNGFTSAVILKQLHSFSNTLSAIESFLLSRTNSDEELQEPIISELAKSTLAYSLSDPEKQQKIVDLFVILSKNIQSKAADGSLRHSFGKTLLGLGDSIDIKEWTEANSSEIRSAESIHNLFELYWPLIFRFVKNDSFRRFSNKEVLKGICMNWLEGESFSHILGICANHDCRIGEGARPRAATIENIVDIFENGLAYDASLIIAASSVFLLEDEPTLNDSSPSLMNHFQKAVKYGLPDISSITLYELGFADRIIAQKLASSFAVKVKTKGEAIEMIRMQSDHVGDIISNSPQYFKRRFMQISKQDQSDQQQST